MSYATSSQGKRLALVALSTILSIAAAVRLHTYLVDRATTAAASAMPIASASDVDQLPAATSCSGDKICTLRDIMAWDLREVVPVAESENKTRKISPSRFINYLHIVRRPGAGVVFRAHYGTSGYGIDFNVITHNIINDKVKKKSVDLRHKGDGFEQYALEVDISQEPIDKEFLLIVEGTYWNGFRKPQETAETYADDETSPDGELAILVLFPHAYPPRNVRHLQFASDKPDEPGLPYKGTGLSPDTSGTYLYWSIRSHQPKYHYQMSWEWDIGRK
jgi:hypothetical protein